jgi:hypothetical protein
LEGVNNIVNLIRRWCVLTTSNLYTFKNEKVYDNATEAVKINKIKIVKSDDKTQTNIFVIFLIIVDNRSGR